jgi:alcohol dehydrogenase (NADP+)
MVVDGLPARGFVTCCNFNVSKADMLHSLVGYLKAGGRMIDTAPVYGFESTVGEAVLKSSVPREEIFISGNIDTDNWRALIGSPKKWAVEQVRKTLQAMNLSYVDSMTLHAGPAQVSLEAPQPIGENVTKWHTMGPADHADMWRGLVEAKKQGLTRHLGVCLTSRLEIENLIQETGEKPAIVMAMYHPWVPREQKKYVKWAQSQDNAVLAFGSFNFKSIPEGKELKAAQKAAERHGVTFGKVAAKWVLDQNVAFMTGMYHPEHLEEDLSCSDFQMDAVDQQLLETAPEWDCESGSDNGVFFSGCVP